MPELTIEEARKIYASSDEMKSLMLTKFSKSELEEHEVTQEEFDKTFLELLGQCTKTVFLNENGYTSNLPTNRIELRKPKDEWMVDICFTGKNKHFWVSYFRVWTIFANTYSLQDDEIQRLMKNQVNTLFGLADITPIRPALEMPIAVNTLFGLADITPAHQPGDREGKVNTLFGLAD